MPKTKDKDKQKRPAPPSAGLAYMVGIILFGVILCPAGVLLSFSVKLYEKLHLNIFYTFTLGCLMGLVLAIILGFIFMRATMKKIKKY